MQQSDNVAHEYFLLFFFFSFVFLGCLVEDAVVEYLLVFFISSTNFGPEMLFFIFFFRYECEILSILAFKLIFPLSTLPLGPFYISWSEFYALKVWNSTEHLVMIFNQTWKSLFIHLMKSILYGYLWFEI